MTTLKTFDEITDSSLVFNYYILPYSTYEAAFNTGFRNQGTDLTAPMHS